MANKDPLVFRGSWRKQLILVAVFFAVGGACFIQGRKFPPMYVIGGFALVLGAVGVWGTIRGWAVLTLDSLGFEIRLYDEPRRYAWSETSNFVPDAFAVLFVKNGKEQQFINVFDATTDVICQTLVSYNDKYGQPRRTDVTGS